MNRSSNRGFGLASIAVVVFILGVSAMFTQANAQPTPMLTPVQQQQLDPALAN